MTINPEPSAKSIHLEDKSMQPEVPKTGLEGLKPEELQFLDEKSRPIRQYLIDNVVPIVTEGLVEICKGDSADPLADFISFLEKKSQEL
jgi:hypothetical protein